MSNTCIGVKDGGDRCGMVIGKEKKYCRHHSKQQYKSKFCLVMHNDGSMCGGSVDKEDKCVFHANAKPCLNSNASAGGCQNYIMIGDYCPQCGKERPSIEKLIEESAKRMSEIMYSKNRTVVRKKYKPKDVSVLESKEVVIPENLKRPTFEKSDSCVICLEDFSECKKSKIKKLSCGHSFHFECLAGLNSHLCPLCRAEIKKGQIPNKIYNQIEENEAKAARETEQYNFTIARRIQQELRDVEQNVDDTEEFLEDLAGMLIDILVVNEANMNYH